MTKPTRCLMRPGKEIYLEVSLRHRLGALALEVDFTLTHPWTVLFAPSGGGKTTILRMLAGLDHPQAGHIAFRVRGPSEPRTEETLADSASRTFVPPHLRGIGMVAQRPALFPHKSVLQNVHYGLLGGWSSRGPSLTSAGVDIEEVLELCHVQHLQAKRPAQLSGGERQRVALARTLAASNLRFLLLDEPFTGLEIDLREDLIRNLRLWLSERNVPVLMVTHDLGEVLAAGAEVLRLSNGRIVAQGPAEEVLSNERARLLRVLQEAPIA